MIEYITAGFLLGLGVALGLTAYGMLLAIGMTLLTIGMRIGRWWESKR